MTERSAEPNLVLCLTPREAKALFDLLDDHLYFGWVRLEGEFKVVATGEVSPALEALYRRVRGLLREAEGGR